MVKLPQLKNLPNVKNSNPRFGAVYGPTNKALMKAERRLEKKAEIAESKGNFKKAEKLRRKERRLEEQDPNIATGGEFAQYFIYAIIFIIIIGIIFFLLEDSKRVIEKVLEVLRF